MLSLVIGLVVTAVAGGLIIKNYQAQTVLLVAGLILLATTSVLFPDHSILYQNSKSLGWKGFDVFGFVKESLTTQLSGIGLIIIPLVGIGLPLKAIEMQNLCFDALRRLGITLSFVE